MRTRVLIAAFALSAALHAEGVLVASVRSNSIEEFDTSGNWLSTFATTGPYSPNALAQSPVTGDVFVTTMWASGPSAGQLTNRILRYHLGGKFETNWDTFTVTCGQCVTSQTQSLLFDRSGNLWVATAYGKDLGGPIFILEYLAADLTLTNPMPQPRPITANMYRGNQMAFNVGRNLCIAGFIDQDVQCFNTSTGAMTADYYAEIHASAVGGIEPAGLAFDLDDRMYLTSLFTGQIVKEVNPGGPIVLMASVIPQLDGNLVLRGADLYTTTYNVSPATFSTPDPAYSISTAGTVTKFIYESAPPALGNDHIWGASWMIFYAACGELSAASCPTAILTGT